MNANISFLFETTVECFNEISDDEIIKNLCLNNYVERKCFIIALLVTKRTSIIKNMSEEFIQEFTFEISKLDIIDQKQSIQSINNALTIIENNTYTFMGGVATARILLEQTFTVQKTIDVFNNLTSSITTAPFQFLENISNVALFNILTGEYIQTIALILGYVSEEKCVEILKMFSENKRNKILTRLENSFQVRTEVLREVERVLERKCSLVQYNDFCSFGGKTYTDNLRSQLSC